jgi:hypothetical protein
LGPPSSTARGQPNAHRIDRSHLPGPRVHLEAPPRPDNNRVSPRAHDRTPPPLYTTATPPVCPPKRAHTKRRLCPQRTRFSFAVGSSTMRPVSNRRLGPIWALLEHENPISGSFRVVHSVGGADTARLHDENEHRHRRKVHTSIAQHQGPLTLVRFVAAGARVAHQARAVVATRSSHQNAQEQPTPATASWGAEETRTRVKTTAFIIPRAQPNALQPPACPRPFWGCPAATKINVDKALSTGLS